MGAVRHSEDLATTDRFDDAGPSDAASAATHLFDELQLHGERPSPTSQSTAVAGRQSPLRRDRRHLRRTGRKRRRYDEKM